MGNQLSELEVGQRVLVEADPDRLRKHVEDSGELEWDDDCFLPAAGRHGVVRVVDEDGTAAVQLEGDDDEIYLPLKSLNMPDDTVGGAAGSADAPASAHLTPLAGHLSAPALKSPMIASLRTSFRSHTSHVSIRETAHSLASSFITDQPQGEITRKLVFVLFTLSFNGFLFGYTTQVFDSSRDLIQFGREGKPGTFISETEKTALSIVSWACAACSALLAGILVKLGRKGLAITASGLFIFGHFMTAGAKNIGTMLIGQVFCGISLGFITTLTPLFLSELAPSSRRGTFVMMYVSLIALGQVAGSAVLVSFSSPSESDNDNWRWPLFLLIIPAVVHFFLLLRIPDSPLCLARKGRTEEAAQLASSLYPGSESALLDVQDAVLKSAGHGSHYYGLIGKHRRTLVSGVLLQLLHQLVGMRAYSASCRSDSSHALLLDQFSTARRNETRFLHEVEAELGLDAVAFFVFVGITCIIPFVRRKKLLLVSTAGTFVALGVTGMGVVANIGLLSFTGVLCTAALYASGIGCVPWIFNSEVYPLRYREVGMGAGTCAFWLGFIITDVLRCPFAGMFGADGSRYLVGSGLCLVALLWVYVVVPETAQVSVVHTEVLRSRKRSQGQEALRSLAETPSRSSCELDELNPSQAHPFSGLPSGREHAHSSNAFAPPQRHSNVLHPSSSALHPATSAGSGNLLPLFDGPQSSEGPSQMGPEHVSH